MQRIIDISPPLSGSIAVFPGDTPLAREVLLDIARGDPITLSTLRATVHLGAHADAPSHYGRDARTIDRQPLDRYLGRCQVVAARVGRGSLVGPDDLPEPITEPRVLIRTGTWPDPSVFNRDFAALSVDLIDHLGDHGVRTIGIDTPSVDPSDSTDLAAHTAILARDLAILECLDLSGAEPGIYELIALPLRLVGFDASPVRAVLRTTS